MSVQFKGCIQKQKTRADQKYRENKRQHQKQKVNQKVKVKVNDKLIVEQIRYYTNHMQNPIESLPLQKNNSRQSTQKNIKQTKMTLEQIKHYENSNFLPFSLKQQHNLPLKQSQVSQPDYSHLGQSNLSQKLHHLSSKTSQPAQFWQYHQNNQAMYGAESSHQIQKQHSHPSQNTRNQNLNQQQNNRSVQNKNNLMQASASSKIHVQVHLTIAKKKFTLKLSKIISSKELTQIVEQFLIENNISNAAKKNHIKTKNSIIQMVEQKLHQSNSDFNENKKILQNLQKISPQTNLAQKQNPKCQGLTNEMMGNERIEIGKEFEVEKSPKKVNIQKMSRKFERPMMKQISRVSVDSEKSEECCSPSFKESQYVEKIQKVNVSKFSPEPQNKENKYQQLVASYYNDRVNQTLVPALSQAEVKGKSFQLQETSSLMKDRQKKNPAHQGKAIELNISSEQVQDMSNLELSSYTTNGHPATSTPKSVYEKWKQKEKSKENPNIIQSFQNALRQKKIPENHQKSANHYQKSKDRQKNSTTSKSITKPTENKWIRKVNEEFNSKKTHNSSSNNLNQERTQKRINEKQNHHDSFIGQDSHSFSNIKKPPLNKTPTKNLNKTQILHDKPQIFNYSPYQQMNQFSSEVSPLKPNRSTHKSRQFQNQKNSKVYTIHDEEYPSVHHQPFQMSPDHFYKQGLIFQAKKQQEMTQKFKSIYPFTTRNQPIDSKSIKNFENSNIKSNKSRQKYFSNKMTNKSSDKLSLSERQKSALHQRLYKEDKQKKNKQVENEANKRIFKIAKTPTPQIQINLMQQNLKQIKGLSQQKKIKLIQKNIQIKQRIREKDKMIDQELQKMIKQGKVRPTCEIVTMRKSPFRKTKVY